MGMQQPQKKESNVIYLNPAIQPDKALKILKKIKAETDSTFKHLLAGMLENMSEAAFEEMDTSDEQDTLERHFNVMRAVKTNQRPFLETFFKSMNQGWLNILKHRDRPAVADATGSAAIEIDRLQRKISIHYKILLAEVNGRFNTIAGREMEFHPLLPNNIFQCYWEATSKLNLNESERILMLSLFNRFVMDKAGKLIGAVNGRLEDFEVEPLQEKKSED